MGKLMIALKLIPIILKAVLEIENVIPLPKKGKEKLEFVLEVAELAGGSAETVKPIVDAAVRLYKKTGIFQ